MGTAFWAAFLIADEFVLVCKSTDLIGVHMRLLLPTLLSALTVVLLPENSSRRGLFDEPPGEGGV